MALSLATDYGTGHPLERALRTCLIAVRLGEVYGASTEELYTTFYTALLRFVGCTADMQSLASIFGDEQVAQVRVHMLEFLPTQMILEVLRHAGESEPPFQRLRKLTYGLLHGITASGEAAIAHCEIAQMVAQRFGLQAAVQKALGQIYERWDGRGTPGQASGEEISLAMRLVHLAQDVEVFERFGGIEAVLEMAKKRSGGYYDPNLVTCFMKHTTAIMRDMDAESVWNLVLALEPQPQLTLTSDALDDAARAIADFTDLRSPYSHAHSSLVAQLVSTAAHHYGLPPAEVSLVRQAGLLHDVGRTAISLQIWDKPGPLTTAEWERVRLYPYYTERILSRASMLTKISTLASQHRERMDGSGYHRGLSSDMLMPSLRLLAAADVYQSKTEPRAYREALKPEDSASELWQQVRNGKLERTTVEAVLDCRYEGKHLKPAYPAGLSEREMEVLTLLAAGLSYRKIAAQLHISFKTVDRHIQNVYNKLGVSTRASATLFAIHHNLVSPQSAEIWR